MTLLLLGFLVFSSNPLLTSALAFSKPAFRVVPLGVLGGIDESNLSSYLTAAYGTNDYIALDAGTLHSGIEKAVRSHVFDIPTEQVLKQYVKGFLISHSHLDHLAGLVMNSPDDSPKNIYAFQECINVFETHYFSWLSWANFANEGEKPTLNQYTYQVLTAGKETSVAGTGLQVTPFKLSHSNLNSTAFLLRNSENYLLYLGDTGADEVEKSHYLQALWEAVGPLVRNGSLKAIMIEVSFRNEVPDKSLFGHLTPRWLMKELHVLAGYSGTAALMGFKVVIVHLKPPLSNIQAIKSELKAGNDLGVRFIYPEQGCSMNF